MVPKYGGKTEMMIHNSCRIVIGRMLYSSDANFLHLLAPDINISINSLSAPYCRQGVSHPALWKVEESVRKSVVGSIFQSKSQARCTKDKAKNVVTGSIYGVVSPKFLAIDNINKSVSLYFWAVALSRPAITTFFSVCTSESCE